VTVVVVVVVVVGVPLPRATHAAPCQHLLAPPYPLPPPHLVGVGAVADKADLRHVRPRAAVGAARHAQRDGLGAEAEAGQQRRDALVDVRQGALRL
jgi:hypothetical protein